MSRSVFMLLVFFLLSGLKAEAQKKECKQKPKRFPSAFSHMTSDYANMNLQADILPRRFFQIESSLLFGALFKNQNGEKYYGYNSNLIRVGSGHNLEIRGVLAIPGRNIQLNNPEIETLHAPLGLGIKANLLAESSNTPGISLSGEYIYYNAISHVQTCLIFDKMAFRIFKLSLSVGPQFSFDGTSKICYSSGVIMKDRDNKLGVYSLVSNRYEYLENIFNTGLVYSDNLNYQLTIGYGVHQSHGLFMFSYTGLLNYKDFQRKIGSFF